LHRAYFQDRFSSQVKSGIVTTIEGDIFPNLLSQPDHSYDLIYVDGDYAIEGTVKDAGWRV